jgi:hypothetical protein
MFQADISRRDSLIFLTWTVSTPGLLNCGDWKDTLNSLVANEKGCTRRNEQTVLHGWHPLPVFQVGKPRLRGKSDLLRSCTRQVGDTISCSPGL